MLSSYVQAVPDCLSVSAGCVKLLQEEGNSVVTPSSERHT